MRRLIANLLMCWTLLLVPGATVIGLAQPETLLPACCRAHGSHHCVMMAARESSGPAWRGVGCPFTHLSPAAILLAPYLPSTSPHFTGTASVACVDALKHALLAAYLAGLPASRAPPILG